MNLRRRLETGRASYQKGVSVLVNGALNKSKTLPPHVAEHAAEKIDDYVKRLETMIADLLRTINGNREEVEH